MKKPVLVLGGTGKTGRKIVHHLAQANIEYRIGSRSAAIPFDWDKPEDWPEVLAGMHSMYISYQPDLAIPGALESIEKLVALAQSLGLKKLVLLSGKGEREAELCEQIVLQSGLEATVLRASWFNQNFSESFFLDPILQGHVALPKAQAQVPYVDTDDIAEVAFKVLTEDGHNQQIYELTGPELWTFEEIIDAIAAVSKRDLQFTPISLSAYMSVMKELQLPEDVAWLIHYLFSEVIDAPGNDFISKDIEKLLGRPATSFQEYLNKTVKTGVWNP